MTNETSLEACAADVRLQTRPPHARWSVFALVLFRFAFIYLSLYSLYLVGVSAQETFHDRMLFPALERFWVMLSVWTAANVFGVTEFNPRYVHGDSVVSYARVALFFLIGIGGTVVWSLVDRRRTQYASLYEWLRLIVSFAVGLRMMIYGFDKILLGQMPPISPRQLIAPLGQYTPRALLWAFMGSAPGYEIFTGFVEALGGALLCVPRLTALGALVTAAAMTHVFLLNVFYDVAQKLNSFHLLVMAAFLLLPDVPRLASVLLFNRATAPVERPQLFQWKRYPRFASAIPVVFLIVVFGCTFFERRALKLSLDSTRLGAVLFGGIWDVEEFVVDGVLHPPLTTDEMRWQKVVFDDGFAVVQRMSGSLIWARTKTDSARKTITFDHTGKPPPELQDLFGPSWKAEFTFDDSSPEMIVLTGRYDSSPATIRLRKNHTRYFLTPHERQWIRRAPPLIPYVG
jgi:hypothetical protein